MVTGPAGGDKGEAEQTLLDRMLAEQPHVFTTTRLFVMDRNFPGVSRIARMIAKTHVLIRVKSDIRLDRIGDFLPDGPYLARLCGGGASVTVRVVEYHVSLDGATAPELFCLVTDLLDHAEHPARLLAAWRWDGSETAPREAESTLHGAGPGTGAMLGSHSPDLIGQEHAAWIVATELVRAVLRPGAAVAAPFTKGTPHRPARPGPPPVVHDRPPRPDRFCRHRDRHRACARAQHERLATGRPRRRSLRPG